MTRLSLTMWIQLIVMLKTMSQQLMKLLEYQIVKTQRQKVGKYTWTQKTLAKLQGGML